MSLFPYYSPRDPFKPVGASMGGFLAPNEVLEDVINRDRQTLQSYGLTCEQVGDTLQQFVNKFNHKVTDYVQRGNKLSWEDSRLLEQYPINHNNLTLDSLRGRGELYTLKLPIDNRYIMGKVTTAGTQTCPFGLPTCHNSGSDFFIFDSQTGQTIEFGELLIHLIRDHCFFEGNVQYRLDPEKVIQFFSLAPASKASV